MPPHKQQRYQPFKNCTYWPVLGSFNNWNIIQFSLKEKSSEDIVKINQVVLHVISGNMSALVQTGKYVDINTTCTTMMGQYVINLFSEAYTLQ